MATADRSPALVGGVFTSWAGRRVASRPLALPAQRVGRGHRQMPKAGNRPEVVLLPWLLPLNSVQIAADRPSGDRLLAPRTGKDQLLQRAGMCWCSPCWG